MLTFDARCRLLTLFCMRLDFLTSSRCGSILPVLAFRLFAGEEDHLSRGTGRVLRRKVL